MQIIHPKSDLKITVDFSADGGTPQSPFEFRYFTNDRNHYVSAAFDGVDYTNCMPVENGIICYWSSPDFFPGDLKVLRHFYQSDERFDNNIFNLIVAEKTEISINDEFQPAGVATPLDDYVDSLRGEKGDVGAKGEKGDVGAKGEKGDVGANGETFFGAIIYRDPEFRNGLNSCTKYAISNPDNVTFERVPRPTDCPTKSTHCLRIDVLGATSPGLAGFKQNLMSRANAVFINRVVAKIPVGYSITNIHNAFGNGGKSESLTPMVGTGKYQQYIWKITCGADGSFSTLNHYYLNGATAPITWYVASATVYDLNDSEVYY